MILGCDVLQQLGAIIDCAKGKINFTVNSGRTTKNEPKIGYLGASSSIHTHTCKT